MTIPSGQQHGASIPDAGSDRKVTLCLPDTWTRLVSGLLVPPTKPYFWDSTANPEDVETACSIAESILAKFLTSDCTSGLYDPGTLHNLSIDFRLGDLEGWQLTRGTLETDGCVGDYQPAGFFWNAALELRYEFDTPVLFTRFQTQGASRFTFGQNSQTFPSVDIAAWKYGELFNLGNMKIQLGQQYGASPMRITFDMNSRELCSAVVVYFDGGFYTDENDAAGVEIVVEQIQFEYYDPT